MSAPHDAFARLRRDGGRTIMLFEIKCWLQSGAAAVGQAVITSVHIFDSVKRVAPPIKFLHLFEPERARSAAPKHNRLISCFIDDAVTIQPARYCERRRLRFIGGD